MKLKVNISPCPNDTFMFEAMLHGRVDTRGLEFETGFADIEELNRRAIAGEADVCKVSCAVLPLIMQHYKVLGSGAALGRGNGPLVVARGAADLTDPRLRLAVPGLHTTANMLISTLFPNITDRHPVLFSEIAPRVSAGEFDAGVLIHEGRFTYAAHGLQIVADLGAEWERRTGLPLPLGAIVVRRDLPESVQKDIESVLRESVRHAFAVDSALSEFVKCHARELDDSVIRSHINLFVNDFSLDLGDEGCRAVMHLTGLGDDIFV